MKNILKTLIAIGTGLAIGVFLVVLGNAVFFSAKDDISVPEKNVAEAAIKNYPVRLTIPAIDVDAKIQQVGVTASGKMAVPTNYTDVGWYKKGAVPGQRGSAVIAGHVDDGLALPGVFKKLSDLKPGDDIYVTTSEGDKLHFVMKSSKAYDKDADTDAIFNDKSGKFLKLITCTGTWLPLQKTHDQRLVVTAVLK